MKQITNPISKRRVLQIVGLAIATIALSAATGATTTPRGNETETAMTQNTTTKPTIVLVHGAFAESASWNGVISKLLAQGYPAVAVANPLRGVKKDSSYLVNVLKGIKGPVVLVGHSYGGLVISEAATGNPNVRGLVFVAAFAPEKGEKAGDLTGRFPGSTLMPTLAPPIPLGDGTNDLYIMQDKYWAQFCADVPQALALQMAAGQRPIVDAAFSELTGEPGWKTIPSWFVFGELDKNIPAAVHRFMADRAKSRETIEVKGASHVVGISHPDIVTKLILKAAESTK
jgi:pimeloyl-ACP methyl ester carboxylesterase